MEKRGPAQEWRERYERFDRKLGFVLGALVGFVLGAGGAAFDVDATIQSVLVTGFFSGLVLGFLVALLGDRVLVVLLRLLS